MRMRLLKVFLYGYRSVEFLEFEAGPFTVLFGKNNAGKTNILEALVGLLTPGQPLPVRGTPLREDDGPSGAVLDEYGGPKLDAAGVKIIPIHGTRNLEGLISAELVIKLGIKFAVLTDATVTATMSDRSGNKRSSEERKVMKVIHIAAERGLPKPTPFGVPEEDLLFAFPTEAIRDYLQGPFPEWKELVAQCRSALGKGPSDSVNWKAYALEQYGLPITTNVGVRNIVRALDLEGVPLPSIQTVIEDVVAWAKEAPAIQQDDR